MIPLTSAKEKHLRWKNADSDRYLIYEMLNDDSCLNERDIRKQEHGKIKHILSAIDIKKMIPVVEGTYSVVDLNSHDKDSTDEKKYKALLNKEYAFVLKILPDVVRKASRIYDKQMLTGNVAKFGCNYRCASLYP